MTQHLREGKHSIARILGNRKEPLDPNVFQIVARYAMLWLSTMDETALWSDPAAIHVQVEEDEIVSARKRTGEDREDHLFRNGRPYDLELRSSLEQELLVHF